jgi:hypothetical protein
MSTTPLDIALAHLDRFPTDYLSKLAKLSKFPPLLKRKRNRILATIAHTIQLSCAQLGHRVTPIALYASELASIIDVSQRR